jgi:hypothetical protein
MVMMGLAGWAVVSHDSFDEMFHGLARLLN